jgi:hypothetical protein
LQNIGIKYEEDHIANMVESHKSNQRSMNSTLNGSEGCKRIKIKNEK